MNYQKQVCDEPKTCISAYETLTLKPAALFSMIRLFILRHAKSSWSMPGARDIDRTLNARGQSDLPNIARAMVEKEYLPTKIYSSSATRTQMTTEGIVAHLPVRPEIEYLPILYSGYVKDYLELIQSHEQPGDLMIVGHNPTCELLVEVLSGTGSETAFDAIAVKYPTGTLSCVTFEEEDWAKIGKGKGHLLDVILPRNLSSGTAG